MPDREEELVRFIDQKILEYGIESLECLANNNTDRIECIQGNVLTIETLKDLLNTKIRVSENIPEMIGDLRVILIDLHKAIENAITEINTGYIPLDEDIYHIARNNFEMLSEYFLYLIHKED